MAPDHEDADQRPPVGAELHYAQISLKPEQGHHFPVVAERRPEGCQINSDVGVLHPAAVVAQLGAGVADSVEGGQGHSVGYKGIKSTWDWDDH